MKYQKFDKEEILWELRIALREKLRKLFILVPVPKDKYYELIPLILALSIELTLNGEISTIQDKGKDSGSAPVSTYDFECKLDLFQTVYYESIGFLPSTFFIETLLNKFTKSENKMGINTAYFNESEKKPEKVPILKGVKKNLWNILNTFYHDQSKSNLSTYKNTSRSRILGNAFAANSNIIHPVASKTLPPLSLSPSRMSEYNISEMSESRRLKLSSKDKDYQMRAVKFDTSTLSPWFDHIYKAQMFASPALSERTHQLSSLPSEFGNSTQTTMSVFSPPQRKPMKLQILKSCHSLMLKHMSQYEADTDQKWAFQVMFEKYNHEEKIEKEEAIKKKQEEQRIREEEKRFAKLAQKLNEEREMLLNQHNQKTQNKEEPNSAVLKRINTNITQPGKKTTGKEDKEPYKRRWFVGKEIDPNGTVVNSPGLFKMVRDIEQLKHRPKLFPDSELRRFSIAGNKHKKLSITEHTQRIVQNLVEQFGDEVMPTSDELQSIKKERERREKINKRFADMAIKKKEKSNVNFEELMNETPSEGAKRNIAGLSKVSQQLASIKRKNSGFVPEIEHPFILPEDIEYEFENVYEDFLEDIKTKQDALESIKLKYKKQAQKLEEENAFNERIKKSTKQVRKDSKGQDKLPRTDNFEPALTK